MKYVIIGNSAAAVGAIEGIRQVDKDGGIVVISKEKYHTYSRPLISYLIQGKVTEDKMYYRPLSFYEENNCKVMLGEEAVRIIPDKKEVELKGGKSVKYDKLLVATGSKPFIVPTEGLDGVENKFTFMSYDDAKSLEASITPDTRVLIVGAGLIGLKCAEGLNKKVKSITVVDLADRVLSSILDEKGSEIMKKHLENAGIEIILSDSVKAYEKNMATLNSGRKVPFDILVIAIGVRPNVELVKEAGGKVNRGIVTDEFQMTSIKDVYAAGDCTESLDISCNEQKILALLPNAYMQGEVAGKNMAGDKVKYEKAIPMNAIGFFGLHIITAGSYRGESYEFIGENSYKRLFINDNRLVGYIMIGEINRAGIYTSLIKDKVDLSTIDMGLLLQKPNLMMFPKDVRKQKLGVGHR
ncbi:MAG: NAD(P)/FAD-dependent oxidoreductase [Clostridiaceae bacterium]|nr:NAD(P)/FAD-dependent oxidoreductase [Clostridiaceae bacterium]